MAGSATFTWSRFTGSYSDSDITAKCWAIKLRPTVTTVILHWNYQGVKHSIGGVAPYNLATTKAGANALLQWIIDNGGDIPAWPGQRG